MNKLFDMNLRKKISLQTLLISNIIIFGSIFLINSMIRFENQVFSCSFWLLCETDVKLNFQNYFLIQTGLTLVGLITLLATNLYKGFYQLIKPKMYQYFLIVFFSSMMILISLVSQIPLQNKILFQIIFSLVISILLINLFLEIKFKSKELIAKPSRFYKTVRLLAVSTVFMTLLGSLTSFIDSSLICKQFPFCFMEEGFRIEILLINSHRIFTFITGVFLIFVMSQTWTKFRENLHLLLSVSVGFAIFFGQSLLGAMQIIKNFDQNLLFIHSISSFSFLLVIFYLLKWSSLVNDSPNKYPKTIFNDSQTRKDYLVLNKPIIVALLLVTTYAGMVVGGEKIPNFSLTFWTMFGGALAAGGASAINQYIDRQIDSSMQRTAKRPLPAGRLIPAEALALGISEIIFSFYIYTSFVNLNAALLAMLGMVYYVFLYSKWLKKLTVQNIVIGGGAGAIPPLVGWAAATGGLNVPSILLFALVFLWTPPHFWALALVRKKDYARANIPMMPVIKGEKKTRAQIFFYTIQLVILTLLMPIFGVGGGIFLLFASILGLWLLHAAWQVYKKEGNKIAFKMYRYSSMYLAFIFLALVIDVLI